jgi:hypothetical protein
MIAARMKKLVAADVVPWISLAVVLAAVPARAQEPPPRIPVVAVDAQGTVPRFPQDAPLAASRGITLTELPGTGLGGQLGAHLYFFKWKAITVGIGGHTVVVRATQTPGKAVEDQIKAVTERFRSLGSQLSLNFGNGNGWSYLSAGIGRSTWSIVPKGRAPLVGDEEGLKTLNYGGGARWFMKSHLAFSFDVRFYAINPSTPNGPLPSSPRTTLMVIGAGISVK